MKNTHLKEVNWLNYSDEFYYLWMIDSLLHEYYYDDWNINKEKLSELHNLHWEWSSDIKIAKEILDHIYRLNLSINIINKIKTIATWEDNIYWKISKISEENKSNVTWLLN